MQFSPERWSNLPETVKDVPGVWGNVFTFLGGARSCIGYRFALVECVFSFHFIPSLSLEASSSPVFASPLKLDRADIHRLLE